MGGRCLELVSCWREMKVWSRGGISRTRVVAVFACFLWPLNEERRDEFDNDAERRERIEELWDVRESWRPGADGITNSGKACGESESPSPRERSVSSSFGCLVFPEESSG